jgi:SRSO17 transposase
MLLGACLERTWHHARAHRFFATARWCADAVGLVLVDLVVDLLLPAGSAITVVVDDTLCKRSGKKGFGVAWQHHGAAKGPKPIGFGNAG